MRWSALSILLLAALMLGVVALGCSGEGESGDEPAAAATPRPAPTTPVETASATTRRQGRPLPAFEGYTLDDRPLALSSLIGRRALLFFFDPTSKKAVPVAEAVARVAEEGSRHNFEVIGVAAGERSAAKRFVRDNGLSIRVIDDSGRRLAAKIGLSTPTAVLLTDGEGYVVRGSAGFPSDGPDPSVPVETELRDWLRLPGSGAAQLELGDRPVAPIFQAPRLDGGEPFDLAEMRGRPLVLIFFLHTCPHCHEALGSLRKGLEALPEATRPPLIGISIVDRPDVVRERLQKDGLDFFPVVFDPDARIRSAYGAQAGVPETFLIDAEGRIAARVSGWREDRDPPLMRMRLAKLAGQTPPMLLHRTGFSGDEFCAVCHSGPTQTWQLTAHAHAFDTLVRHGADHDGECVGCHVVGFGETGGYSIAADTPHLEGVGCETCHGRGGPHLSPEYITAGNYEPVCVTCHDTKHSLGFDYDSFVPRVSHAANLHLTGLSLEEKRELLAKSRSSRKALLPTQAAYVGSEACRSCHAAEHETWSKQPHARAMTSLAAKGETGNADCLRCHTTGYEAQGGFPAGASAADHPDLAAVGCESCHGPGADHVGPEARRIGTILSLGDKCDSCVILQICGSCHDDANDPGFEFEVQDKIDAQRHGTIEPGTGKPKDAEAAATTAPTVLLEEAFRRLDATNS